jgi:hypothetical protein
MVKHVVIVQKRAKRLSYERIVMKNGAAEPTSPKSDVVIGGVKITEIGGVPIDDVALRSDDELH